jgi:hypothetical protein
MRDRDLLDELLENGLTLLHDPYRALNYFIPFHKVESEKFTMTVTELKPYEMPSIASIIEANSVKSIQTSEDERFIKMFLS